MTSVLSAEVIDPSAAGVEDAAVVVVGVVAAAGVDVVLASAAGGAGEVSIFSSVGFSSGLLSVAAGVAAGAGAGVAAGVAAGAAAGVDVAAGSEAAGLLSAAGFGFGFTEFPVFRDPTFLLQIVKNGTGFLMFDIFINFVQFSGAGLQLRQYFLNDPTLLFTVKGTTSFISEINPRVFIDS